VATTKETKPSAREVRLARQLVSSLSNEWEPEKYKDDYREKILEMIEAKAEGNEIAVPEAPERPALVVDLMAALEASLARAGKATGEDQGQQQDAATSGAPGRGRKRASA